MTHTPNDITRLLNDAANGEETAILDLWETAQEELRTMAAAMLVNERQSANLQPTLVVNEVYLRMNPAGQAQPRWENRSQFFGYAWRVMRQFMVDYARTRGRQKRGGDRGRVPMEIAEGKIVHLETIGDHLEDLIAALDKLAKQSPRQHEVLWRRMALEQSPELTAASMGISARTVSEDWRYARAWLHREIVERSGD